MILSTSIQCFKDWQSKRSQVDEQERCERKNKDSSSGSEGRVCHQLMDGSFLSFLRSDLLSRNECSEILQNLLWQSSSGDSLSCSCGEVTVPGVEVTVEKSGMPQVKQMSEIRNQRSEAMEKFIPQNLNSEPRPLTSDSASELRFPRSDISFTPSPLHQFINSSIHQKPVACGPSPSSEATHLSSLCFLTSDLHAQTSVLTPTHMSEVRSQISDISGTEHSTEVPEEYEQARFGCPLLNPRLSDQRQKVGEEVKQMSEIRNQRSEAMEKFIPQNLNSEPRPLTSDIRYPTADFRSPSFVSPLISERIERIERFRLILDSEGNTIRVSLEPDGIGRVEISLSAQKGLINGHINVQDPLSKEVIARNIHALSEMLQREGINIGNLTVDLNGKNRYRDREDLRDQQVSRINMGPLKSAACKDCSSNLTFATKQNRPASGLVNLFA